MNGRWPLSSLPAAALLLLLAAVSAAVLCALAALKRRRVRAEQQAAGERDESGMGKALGGMVQWSAASGREGGVSPVWQRRILMGERCEMPRFSGLILYDERGRPLSMPTPHHHHELQQEMPVPVALKDLL